MPVYIGAIPAFNAAGPRDDGKGPLSTLKGGPVDPVAVQRFLHPLCDET